jgi:S1-C subfamily serine protease
MFTSSSQPLSGNERGRGQPHSKTHPRYPRTLLFPPGFGVRLSSAALLWVLLASSPVSARADELSDKGRAIFKKNQHTVVTVQLVLKSKVSFGGRGGEANESRQDVTGTIVDPSGLAVLSLSATDPTALLQNMMSGLSDSDSKFKMESELSDVKILLDDGTEVPAEVVLRDKDLDLAFIRPKAKLATPMNALDLNNASKADILDQVITLNRLGSAAGRSYSAAIERISAVVQKPRLYYIPDSTMTTTTLGAPAFTLDGKALGIFVMRSTKSKGGGGMGMFGMQPENVTSIIVPVADISKALKQVPAVGEQKEKEKEKENK